MSRHPSNGALMRVPITITRTSHANLSNQKITFPCAAHRQKLDSVRHMNRVAGKNASTSRSITDEWSEYFTDILMDHEVSNVILIGRFPIDDDESRAGLLCHQRKARGGPYNQR